MHDSTRKSLQGERTVPSVVEQVEAWNQDKVLRPINLHLIQPTPKQTRGSPHGLSRHFRIQHLKALDLSESDSACAER